MKKNKNINKRTSKALSIALLALMVISISSCDFSYEIAEANSKEDTKPPTAFFGAVNGETDQWNKVNFVNESISANRFIWNYGDGTTSDEFEEEHSYAPVTASYEVSLEAYDNNGLTDSYTRTVSIINNGTPLGDLNLFYDLINAGDAGEPVTIHSYSSYQVEKNAYAENTLDKNGGTLWTAQDDLALIEGSYRSDGEYLIYDLASIVDLSVIQFTTNVKSDSYGYQIWTSNTGTEDGDFTKIIPEEGDIMLSEAASSEFQVKIFPIAIECRYVKLIGFGRFDEAGTTRKSQWISFSQIEFFKTKE